MGAEDKVITIHFEHFELESSSYCEYDGLRAYEGEGRKRARNIRVRHIMLFDKFSTGQVLVVIFEPNLISNTF